MPHHDKFDSTTSQSKGITSSEVVSAKQRLLEFLAQDDAARRELVRLTLTLDSSVSQFTTEEQEQLVRSLIKPLIDAAKTKRVPLSNGRYQYSAQVCADEAEQICKAFNTKALPSNVVDVHVSSFAPDVIVNEKVFNDGPCAVSIQQAIESVRSHDKLTYFDQGKEGCDFESAKSGLFTKRFGTGDSRYTVIVIAAVDALQRIHVYAALKAAHQILDLRDDDSPLVCLRKFLAKYGKKFSLPNYPECSLIIGDKVPVPDRIRNDRDFTTYVSRSLITDRSEPFGFISHTSKSVLEPSVRVHFLFLFARERYLRDLGYVGRR